MADSLANDDVKYVTYAIVFTKPGRERVMPCGEGSMVLTEAYTETQFISAAMAKYISTIQEKDPGDQCRRDYDRLLSNPADARYMKVYYVNPSTWPREPVRGGERQANALERLAGDLRGR